MKMPQLGTGNSIGLRSASGDGGQRGEEDFYFSFGKKKHAGIFTLYTHTFKKCTQILIGQVTGTVTTGR